jgi:U3 small nucleolar RNA-associated protein 3
MAKPDGEEESESDDENVDSVEKEEEDKAVEESDHNSDDDNNEENNDVDDKDDVDDEIAVKYDQRNHQRSVNEARFGLRSLEVKQPSKSSRKRFVDHVDDFGDLEQESSKTDSKLLASTINAIEQRSHSAARKRRPAPIAEELDDMDVHDDRLAEGIKIMEEELGKLDSDGDDGAEQGGMNDDDDEDMNDPDLLDDSMEFYKTMAKKSKDKKSFKKSLYQVAPKYPRVDGEVDGERAISRTILKNRGLVAHKAKINRNPRVKKREQYRKALIRRKGAVREVRKGESHVYGGEGTGIKSGISRSRKLSSKQKL